MRFLLPFVLTASLLVSDATAHGVLKQFTADDKVYKGQADPDDPDPTLKSPIREVASTGPEKDVTSNDLACGVGSQVAALDAPVDAGSEVVFSWTTWPHLEGPIITYIAPCPAACSTVQDPYSLEWYKIDQAGALDNSETTWVQSLLDSNVPYNLTLPNLKSGYYMLRHEIIALHTAQTQGGAEFYPQCVQVQITGSGDLSPDPSSAVKFPGAYKATDPGIFIDVYTNFKISSYQFPGGPLAKFVGGDSGNTTASTISATSTGGPASASVTNSAAASASTTNDPSSAASTTVSRCAIPSSTATGASRRSTRRRRLHGKHGRSNSH